MGQAGRDVGAELGIADEVGGSCGRGRRFAGLLPIEGAMSTRMMVLSEGLASEEFVLSYFSLPSTICFRNATAELVIATQVDIVQVEAMQKTFVLNLPGEM
jgi:hypothetical protein